MVVDHQVTLLTKYQDSRPYGFRQEHFFVFFTMLALISLCKACDPQEGAIFDPRGII